MLTTSRRALLLERLDRDGQLVVTPLAAELGLSEDTLRRDLRELAAEGKLLRVHGGALPASPTHRPLEARRAMEPEAKVRLAAAAAGLVGEGQIVVIDGGTTHAGIAVALPRERCCTIVTHSPAIALSFEHHPRAEIVLIGGRIFRHSMVACGPATVEGFARLRADLCLLGVTGVHPEVGLTTGDAEEAALKRQMLDCAAETVVLATPDKLGRASPWGIAPLCRLAALVSVGARPGWLDPAIGHIGA